MIKTQEISRTTNTLKSIVWSEKQVYRGSLLLVNEHNPIKVNEHNPIMVNEDNPIMADVGGQLPVDETFPEVTMNRGAVNALRLLLQEIGAGECIVPVSGYRSEAEQKAIYEQSLRESGAAFTGKYVALPGHSEHQTGLAIDLGLKSEQIDFICPEFPYEGICQVFREAAPRFGYIERYPKGKEMITGIAHEPWHFRYVGYPHSEIMNELGLTLEEYIEMLRNHRVENSLKMRSGHQEMEIFFAQEMAEIPAELPGEACYQVSGNNVDGVIVTLWRKSYEV